MLKRFRFSLLSLLVGVVLAGGVGWLNVRPSEIGCEPFCRPDRPEGWTYTYTRSYGWPFDAHFSSITLSADGDKGGRLPQEYVESHWEAWDRDPRWLSSGVARNIAIGLAIVFGGAGVCEYVARRWGRKTEM